jgi:hypothetical protein
MVSIIYLARSVNTYFAIKNVRKLSRSSSDGFFLVQRA